MIDDLLRMARQLGDASNHLHQAAEALSGPAVGMPPTLDLASATQVSVRAQLLLAEIEAPAAHKPDAAQSATERLSDREDYYDNLERFRAWALQRRQPFQVAMRAALAAYMGEQPTLPPARRKGPRGRPSNAAAQSIVAAVEKSVVPKPAPTATTSPQSPPRSKLLGKTLSAEHRAAISAGRARAKAERLAKEAAHEPIVPRPPAPASKHESRPRFAGIDAQPINVMRVPRKDQD